VDEFPMSKKMSGCIERELHKYKKRETKEKKKKREKSETLKIAKEKEIAFLHTS
jgi:hypothetical protein